MEEEEGGPKKGLEDVMRNAPFEEISIFSQHEELQDLEPHGGKTVRPSLQGD